MYDIVVVPAATAVAMPDAEPMVAISGAADVHVPPPVVFVCVAVVAAHSTAGPAIAAGLLLTVKVTMLMHPVPEL